MAAINVFVAVCLLCVVSGSIGTNITRNKNELKARPCIDVTCVIETFHLNQPPGDENKFWLTIDIDLMPPPSRLPAGSRIYITLDSRATVMLDHGYGRISSAGAGRFRIDVHTEQFSYVTMQIKGVPDSPVPNVLSVVVNRLELCPSGVWKGFWDRYIVGEMEEASSFDGPSPAPHRPRRPTSAPPVQRTTEKIAAISTAPRAPSEPEPAAAICGRKQVAHNELITNALGTKAGDWPWHAALYKVSTKPVSQSYVCGGSLLSTTRILTAAHCVTENHVKILPERLYAVLGKYNLLGGDIAPQEKGVFEVIVHENFAVKNLENDIAIVKLSSVVTYGMYVQPICLWKSDSVEKSFIFNKMGTVVGWGFTEEDKASTRLQQATMPVVNDLTCFKSFPTFYDMFLTDNTYCAGFRNGTSVCNGDSGGGMFFKQPAGDGKESWFLRGIVSLSVNREDKTACDPNHYVVFTDTAKYLDWIRLHL